MVDDMTSGERIAKVLARAGVASRRGAEILIVEGRVKVNGRVIDSPALNVGPRDMVIVMEPVINPDGGANEAVVVSQTSGAGDDRER